jgi:hypothetical protein
MSRESRRLGVAVGRMPIAGSLQALAAWTITLIEFDLVSLLTQFRLRL